MNMDAKKQNEKNRPVLREIRLSFVVRPDWTDFDPNWKDSESTDFMSSYRRRYYAEKVERIYLNERRGLLHESLDRDHPFIYGCRRLAVWDTSVPDAGLAGLVGFSLFTSYPVAEDFEDRLISDSLWIAGRIVSRVRKELPQVGLTVTARLTVSRGVRTDRLPEIVVHDFRGKDYAESFSKSQRGK